MVYHNIEWVYEPRLEPVSNGYLLALYQQIHIIHIKIPPDWGLEGHSTLEVRGKGLGLQLKKRGHSVRCFHTKIGTFCENPKFFVPKGGSFGENPIFL